MRLKKLGFASMKGFEMDLIVDDIRELLLNHYQLPLLNNLFRKFLFKLTFLGIFNLRLCLVSLIYLLFIIGTSACEKFIESSFFNLELLDDLQLPGSFLNLRDTYFILLFLRICFLLQGYKPRVFLSISNDSFIAYLAFQSAIIQVIVTDYRKRLGSMSRLALKGRGLILENTLINCFVDELAMNISDFHK